ncbi:SHOCT domain-containing protein [Sulfobacillus thermosulfidooxidans]|uniref:SHOCT domain-containing protein n=1 Tax=Sulfobacillus thermosulfidooxidans TaxID=28034 RepID=UPI0006B4B759|nr:SHOCT domain-containing protein [Sulfobacillus thermosulfidooxidans]
MPLVPQPPSEIPTAIFNIFMLMLLWRFTVRLLRGPKQRRRHWMTQRISQSPFIESAARPQTPLEIAQDRYARGEIDDKEFEQIVEHLLKSRSSSQDW